MTQNQQKQVQALLQKAIETLLVRQDGDSANAAFTECLCESDEWASVAIDGDQIGVTIRDLETGKTRATFAGRVSLTLVSGREG